MFGRNRNSSDELRSQLQDDIRRCAGYMMAHRADGSRLEVSVPPGIVVCCDAWNGWHRSLAARRLKEAQEDDS